MKSSVAGLLKSLKNTRIHPFQSLSQYMIWFSPVVDADVSIVQVFKASRKAGNVVIWLLAPRFTCMRVLSLLNQREHCYCHFTQYTTNRRWSSIDNCGMGSTSKETLTPFSVLLVHCVLFTACEKVSCPDYVRLLSWRVQFLDAPASLPSTGCSIWRQPKRMAASRRQYAGRI